MAEKEFKVLVVDDEVMVSNILRDFLEDEDFIVDTASSGSEALEKLLGQDFNAAIIDMTLNDMDGDTLIVKVLKQKPELLCFIHTGSSDYILPDELKSLGLTDDHIFYKPIQDMTEFSTRIRKIAM